jgi:hypothetical protein
MAQLFSHYLGLIVGVSAWAPELKEGRLVMQALKFRAKSYYEDGGPNP